MTTSRAFRALASTAVLAAVAAIAAPASAASPIVTLTSVGDPNTLTGGQQLIANFNDANNPVATLLPGFSLQLNGATVGVNEGGSGYSGTLPNDDTHYLTLPGGSTATLFSTAGLTSFSFYMGSPDWYNSVHFIGDNGYDEVLSGGQMTAGNEGQSWGWGTRINFDFGGAKVNQIVLSSSQNSFEVDNFAGKLAAAVPEPGTWAMMIVGFGGVGGMIRRRRTTLTLA